MDAYHQRMLDGLRKRHSGQMIKDVDRIIEYAGYAKARLLKGQADSAAQFASTIAQDASDMIARSLALATLAEGLAILETHD